MLALDSMDIRASLQTQILSVSSLTVDSLLSSCDLVSHLEINWKQQKLSFFSLEFVAITGYAQDNN